MPRYFFHRSDGGFSPDAEGTDLRDLQSARSEAIAYAAETLKDRPDIVWTGHEMRIHVTDENGTSIFTVVISMEDHVSG